MGLVYEAFDPVEGTEVALKVMAVNPSATPDSRRRQLERFQREARALAALSHPNVVHVLSSGEVEGRHYFSMELVRGTNLRDRLQFQGPLSVPEIMRLALDLCAALEHIHAAGVVHRDVKPDNIMLMPDGSAKLMDFGIAQIVGEAASAPPGGFQGSPAYMSPEQVAGLGVDYRTDIYSLAITLYEASTGRRAVEGDSIPVITHRVVHEYPPAPVGLPPFLQGILMRGLQKDPGHRYQSAAIMAEDVQNGRMPSAPVPAPPPAYTPPERTYLGVAPEPPTPDYYPAPTPAESSQFSPFAAPPVASVPAVSEFVLPGGQAPEQVRSGCRMHPKVASAARCAQCGFPMCYTCTLEVPGRGVICRNCAFGPR
jgi:serine/threonine-protein kinase